MSNKLQLSSPEILQNFHDGLVDKMKSVYIQSEVISEVMDYVTNHDLFLSENEDIKKSRRVKKEVSMNDQCNATRIDGKRCTRRKKQDVQYCGTHLNCSSHIEFNSVDIVCPIKDKTVSAIDVQGIIYYIDADLNVYNTEDVIKEVLDPSIIGRACINNGVYTIPSLGLV